MKSLTPAQRRALNIADTRKGGAPIATETPLPKGHVTSYTANRLVGLGWATRVNDTLLITKAGREVLNAPIPEDPDVFLRIGDGLTTRREDAVITELILDAHTLQPFWKEQALRNKAETRKGREHARQLRRTSRNWPTSGPCGPVVVRWEDDEAA